MLLLIDNYDSFTHNLARYFEELQQQVIVVRNDEISCLKIEKMAPDYLVFSPGPCTPDSAGITLKAIETFAGHIPILGVCLGHQAIGMAFGAKLVNAQQIRHGKTSQIQHDQTTLFKGINHPFTATRYHSLVLEAASMPEEFKITAWCYNLDPAVKPREIAASTGALGYGEKVLFTNKVTTNFSPTPITPLATTVPTSSTAESRFNNTSENSGTEQISGQAEVMAIEHKTLPIFGVQFHPESLLTEFGHHILNNFITLNEKPETQITPLATAVPTNSTTGSRIIKN